MPAAGADRVAGCVTGRARRGPRMRLPALVEHDNQLTEMRRTNWDRKTTEDNWRRGFNKHVQVRDPGDVEHPGVQRHVEIRQPGPVADEGGGVHRARQVRLGVGRRRPDPDRARFVGRRAGVADVDVVAAGRVDVAGLVAEGDVVRAGGAESTGRQEPTMRTKRVLAGGPSADRRAGWSEAGMRQCYQPKDRDANGCGSFSSAVQRGPEGAASGMARAT